MRVHSSGLLMFVLAALVVSAADPVTQADAVPPAYSHDEAMGLLVCMGMSDMAGSIAQQKLDNVPLEKVKSHYAKVERSTAVRLTKIDEGEGQAIVASSSLAGEVER